MSNLQTLSDSDETVYFNDPSGKVNIDDIVSINPRMRKIDEDISLRKAKRKKQLSFGSEDITPKSLLSPNPVIDSSASVVPKSIPSKDDNISDLDLLSTASSILSDKEDSDSGPIEEDESRWFLCEDFINCGNPTMCGEDGGWHYAPPGAKIPSENEELICSEYDWSRKVINDTDLTSSQKKIVEKLLNDNYHDESGLRGGNLLRTLSHKLKIKFKKKDKESIKLAQEDWSDNKDTSKA